jgi:hypothetical protein
MKDVRFNIKDIRESENKFISKKYIEFKEILV